MEEKDSLTDEIFELIHEKKLDGKKIYAMGGIPNVTIIQKSLIQKGLSIHTILDNNPRIEGTVSLETTQCRALIPIHLTKEDIETGLVIIYSIRFWCEMKEQMEELGFTMGKTLFVLKMLTLEKKKAYIKTGNELYKKFKKKYGKDSYFFLFLGPIGDNYLFGGFYKEYIRRKKINNPVCLGTKNTEKIADLYNLDNFLMLTEQEVLALEFLYMFKCEHLSLKILQIWDFQFHVNRERIRFNESFTFMDTYRTYIYHLDHNVEFEHPVFTYDEEKCTELFDGNHLQRGQTIVLAPYAYSIKQRPPQLLWLELERILYEKGYNVAVNINPLNEMNFFKQAPTLLFPIAESVKYLEFAGGFVGMRSGFCDVISSALCNKVILYPERIAGYIDYENHRPDVDFGGLKNMGLCSTAYELEFDNTATSDNYWCQMAMNIAESVTR